jgi:hypothetical protein
LYCDLPVPSVEPTTSPTWAVPMGETPCNIPGYGLVQISSYVKKCLPCRVGYANPFHRRWCLPCQENTIAATEGSEFCTACPAGTVSNLYSAGTYCTAITPTVNPTTTPTSETPFYIEMPCTTQGYGLTNNANGVKECLPCRVGWANNNNMEGRFCHECRGNTIAATVGSVFCTPCPAGTVSNANIGGTYCTAITPTVNPTTSPTWAEPWGEMRCTIRGYGLRSNANGVLECLPCPIGYANPFHRRYCDICQGNTIAAQEGLVDCTPCPAGTVSNANSGGTYCTAITPTRRPSKIRTFKPTKPPVPAPTFRPTKQRPTRRPTKYRPTPVPNFSPSEVAYYK